MKIKAVAAVLIATAVLSGCGGKTAPKPETETDNKVELEEESLDNEIVTDEAEIAENRQAVTGMLECFKNGDYEGALEYIRESDRELFDFENESQRSLYDALFPRLEYEFGESFVRGGGRYVRVDITAPDMLDIYGKVNLEYMDAMMNGELSTADEARDFNNRALSNAVAGEDVKTKTTSAEVEIQVDDDGAARVVMTNELMNAMLGDIQNASEQVGQAIDEGMSEYNNAKESGAIED